MSNTLTKLIKIVSVLTPGYTVRTWHPAETSVIVIHPVIWGWDPFLPRTKCYPIDPSAITPYQRTFPNWGSVDAAGEFGYGWRQIPIQRYTGEVDQVITTTYPGYYSYDVVPGFTTTTYDPNIGWNSSARSIESIWGDGQGAFSVPVGDIGVVVGLNNSGTSGGSDYFEISHGIYLSKGNFRVCERGVLQTTPTGYTGTDVFTVTRKGLKVYYAKNNVTFYESLVPLSGEVVLDSSLYFVGDSITDPSLVTTSVVGVYAGVTASMTSMGALATSHSGVGSPTAYAGVSASFPSLTVTSTITAAPEGISGSFQSLAVLGTSGWPYYSAISGSFASMTSTAYAESIAPPTPTYASTTMLPLYSVGYGTTGGNTLPSVMDMAPMQAFGTLHAGVASPYAFAEAISSFAPMEVEAGDFPSYDAYLFAPSFSMSLHATGFHQDANQVNAALFTMSLAAAGGGRASSPLFSLALSSTGTLLERGSAALPLFTSTLSSTGTTAGNGAAGLSFFTSTITARGGARAALTAPTFGITATGTNPVTGTATLPLWEFSLSSTGTKATTGTAALPFVTFGLSYATFSGAWPLFSLSSAGSDAVSNTVAYVMNVHTQESVKYSNFGFLHIINIGGKPYGVKSDGLYLLEGTTDNGVAINGSATTKETDFGTFQSKHAPTIYLNSDTLTTITPIVDSVTYPAYSSTFGGRKTVIARGIAGRYWRFKIDGIQQLEGVEFLPETRQKRVK